MIVVNHAIGKMGETAEVVVAGALQTSAGRLIFAELKENSKLHLGGFERPEPSEEEASKQGKKGAGKV